VGFLNVDLEIVSRSKLDAVGEGISKLAHALYSAPLRKGVYLLAVECNRCPKNADAGILALCDAVDQLGRAERRLWDRALSRRFDVGYSFTPGVSSVQVALDPGTLERVVALGGTVAFTCYEDLDSEQAGCTERRDRVSVDNRTSLARRR
jgi:hypothetical protein